MKTFTKHILGCLTMAGLLLLIACVLMPALASVSSDVLASLGFLALIGLAIGASVLIRYVLSFDYHRDINKK